MISIAILHKNFSPSHLETVKAEMGDLGAPQIKCIWSDAYGVWLATEGCHRLRAAKALGLSPVIVDVSDEESIEFQYDGEMVIRKVSELLEELQASAPTTTVLDFQDAE